jgi:hypothetical protein
LPVKAIVIAVLTSSALGRVSSMLRLGICAALAGPLMGGCVYWGPDLSAPPAVGRRLQENDFRFIAPGITSRDEVIAKLGRPTIELEGFNTLAYSWTEVRDFLFVPAFTVAGGTDYMQSTLFIAMGRDDRVLKTGVDNASLSNYSIVTQARHWAQANDLSLPARQAGFSAPASADGRGVIVVYRTKPAGAGALGFPTYLRHSVGVAVDGQFRAELLDGEHVMIRASPGSRRIAIDSAPPYRKSFLDGSSSTVTLEILENGLHFLEAQGQVNYLGRGFTQVVTSLAVRNESEAKQALENSLSVW